MANNQIALLAQTPEFDSPVQSATKRLQLQALMNAQEDRGMEMQQRRQTLAELATQRAALQADPTGGEGYLKALAAGGAPSAYFAAKKAQQDFSKTAADVEEKKVKTKKEGEDIVNLRMQRARDLLGTVNTREGAAQWVRGLYSDPDVGGFITQQLGPVEGALGRIPDPATDPQGFAKWKMGSQLGADNLVKHTDPDANAQLQAATSIKTTGMNNDTSRANTAANNATSRANNAANIAKDFAVNGMNKDGTPAADVETMANGIASGKLAPINGFALAKPRGQAIMARVMEINPNYDAGDYAAKNAALKGFSTGKEGTALRSFNVATDHLETLGAMADALNNGNLQLLNKAGNIWNQQTGAAAPTNFNAVKEIVGKEVVKAIVAGGGGVEERREMSQLLDAANSPAQLKGVITHFKELMQAQRDGLMDQYERTTGRKDGASVFAASKRPATAAVPDDIAELLKKHGGK
jgi:hypothetical protein